ncbi:MAG: hypothetical protein RLZZ535_3665 [Cyanobacteriota bacterium]
MVSYQNFAVKLTTILAIALINLLAVYPAAGITQDFQLHSEQGYQVETSFSYDETKKNPGAIAAQGKEANEVDYLKVRFYDPDGEMIASYDNIVDGIIQNNYFEFNYDLNTQQLLGKVDIGGEVAGEMYLKGDVDQGLSLIMIEPSGEEKVIDQVKSNQ